MSKAIVLQHVPHEGPGRIGPVFRDHGVRLEVRRLDRGDAVPSPAEDFRILIVMGGPMGVADIGNTRYPFLAGEVALLKELIAQDRPVLGICLGAQLLAHAAGGKVYPNTKPSDPSAPLPEIGWGKVSFPFPGGTDPIVMGLPDGVSMFHWHFDTFELPKPPPAQPPAPTTPSPPGAVLLSSTAICRNQAYRLKNRLIGFQYHFEMDRDGIEAMLTHARDDWMKVLGPSGDQQIRTDTDRCYTEYERLGNRLITNLLQYMKLY